VRHTTADDAEPEDANVLFHARI
ncbi:MAG: hypothetical protein JWR15_1418, partial [Prosthecobacter sp.]|nr:hypothetical protein [Prosthecobacter sp.]